MGFLTRIPIDSSTAADASEVLLLLSHEEKVLKTIYTNRVSNWKYAITKIREWIL